jgi:hypothetical protein
MAAGNTYEAIATTTTSGSPSTVTFTSIPSTYTDLVLVSNVKMSTGKTMTVAVNDSASGYSQTNLYGTGANAISNRNTSQTAGIRYMGEQANVSTTNFDLSILQVMNYSNTTTYKTFLCRTTQPSATTEAIVGLWQNTAAINKIVIAPLGGGATFADGCIFSLYGIKSA